jgi:2-methylisocitrate lyase-like PEP mutase family enzyme
MLDKESLSQKARSLLSLHTEKDLLILPNVWNPVTARILEAKGYPAVATASAAVSASLGYKDGEKIKRSTLLDIVSRIAGSVGIPVTADIESGYGESIPELKQTVGEIINAGVVGINIEDSFGDDHALRTIEDQCRRISAVREEADRRNIPLVINARIDVFLSPSATDTAAATEAAISRANAYVEGGADCVYPIGPGDENTARILRAGITGPINLLITPDAAPLSVLEAIGINRVSFGPFVFRSLLRKFEHIADCLKAKGDYTCFGDMLSKVETEAYLRDDFE